VFDNEFDEDTLQLFERVKLGKIICVYSDLTETELVKAPDIVKEYFKNLPNSSLEIVEINDDIIAQRPFSFESVEFIKRDIDVVHVVLIAFITM